MHGRFLPSLTLPLLALVSAPAQAGPPLLCFPIEAQGAPSLPWGGDGWHERRTDYDRSRLAGDTIALLDTQAPALARMETLRRAVLYARDDAAAAGALFDALRARASRQGDAQALALARFDLGYATAAFRQAEHASKWPWQAVREAALGARANEDGYALVRDAIAVRGSDPEMEYAAALITAGSASRAVSDEHLRRALPGAVPGSALARTVAAHRAIWGERLSTLAATR